MAGDEAHVIAQWEEFLPNAADQGGVVPLGKIGTPDGPLEEHVPHLGQAFAGVVEDQVSRGVAGAVQHLKALLAEAHLVPLVEPAIGLASAAFIETEHVGLLGHVVEPEGVGLMGALDGHMQLFGQLGAYAVDPRAAVRLQVVEPLTLKAGGGIYHRVPEPDEIFEPWGNPDLELERAIHGIGGFEWSITDAVELDVQGYYKHLDNLVAPTGDERVYDNSADGYVYGGEVMLRHVERVLTWVNDQPGMDYLVVDYNGILTDPAPVVSQVNAFLGGGLDEQAMLAVVDPELYRQRQ